MRHCEDVPQSQDSRTSRRTENLQWNQAELLVARTMDVCEELHSRMWFCQQFKINRSPSNPAYIAIEGANNTRPFAKCSMDLIMDLLPVEKYNSILVVIDRGLSKGVILCPCAKTITWKKTATLLHDNLLKRFGLLDEMISDRDPIFAAHTF
jgi:hypothetical protein